MLSLSHLNWDASTPAKQRVDQTRTLGRLVFLFVLGWITEDWSLFDFGRYSVPLLYVAVLPFCARISSRSICFLLPVIVSTAFGILVGPFEGLDATHIASQAVLQILAIAFAAGIASVEWRRHIDTLANAILVLAVPVVAYGGYQMIARAAHLPFAFLPVTNQQLYALGGLQRGWEKPQFTRASSLFVEPASFGYFCLWLLIIGLSKERGRARLTALVLAFAGILFSQSLSAALGAGIIIIAYLLTNPINFNVLRQILVVALLSALALAIIPPLMPEAFSAFSERIQQALSLDERADSGRVDRLPANIAMIEEAPLWGHGVSSMTTDGVTRNITSITYTLLLMERGIVGTVLFFLPWIYVLIRSFRLKRTDKCRTLAILLSTVHMYGFATSSLAYSLPFWFALGILASLTLHTYTAGSPLPRRRYTPAVLSPR